MRSMGRPTAIIPTLLILVVSAHSYPYDQTSENGGFSLDLFDMAKDLISFFGNVEGQLLEETGNQTGLEMTQGYNVNPEESGEYFQGDMIIPKTEMKTRNGLKAVRYRWPDAVIPYKISPSFNAQQQKLIREAMNEFHMTTCIKFKPYTSSDYDYVNIKSNEKGCWSHVGRVGGKQDLNLEIPGCVYMKGTVIHELMHSIGFHHEQSRSDRDNYVDIQWQNIKPKHKHNFGKYNQSQISAFGVGYDYGSIMHYAATAFSNSYNLPSIIPKGNKNVEIGQRKALSHSDMVKIRRMYNCYNQMWKIE